MKLVVLLLALGTANVLQWPRKARPPLHPPPTHPPPLHPPTSQPQPPSHDPTPRRPPLPFQLSSSQPTPRRLSQASADYPTPYQPPQALADHPPPNQLPQAPADDPNPYQPPQSPPDHPTPYQSSLALADHPPPNLPLWPVRRYRRNQPLLYPRPRPQQFLQDILKGKNVGKNVISFTNLADEKDPAPMVKPEQVRNDSLSFYEYDKEECKEYRCEDVGNPHMHRPHALVLVGSAFGHCPMQTYLDEVYSNGTESRKFFVLCYTDQEYKLALEDYSDPQAFQAARASAFPLGDEYGKVIIHQVIQLINATAEAIKAGRNITNMNPKPVDYNVTITENEVKGGAIKGITTLVFPKADCSEGTRYCNDDCSELVAAAPDCGEATKKDVVHISFNITGTLCYSNWSLKGDEGAPAVKEAQGSLWNLFPLLDNDKLLITCVAKVGVPITAVAFPPPHRPLNTMKDLVEFVDLVKYEVEWHVDKYLRKMIEVRAGDAKLTGGIRVWADNATVVKYTRVPPPPGCECGAECERDVAVECQLVDSRVDLLLFTNGSVCRSWPAQVELSRDGQSGSFLHLLQTALAGPPHAPLALRVCDVSHTFVADSVKDQWKALQSTGGFHAVRFQGTGYDRNLIEAKLRHFFNMFPPPRLPKACGRVMREFGRGVEGVVGRRGDGVLAWTEEWKSEDCKTGEVTKVGVGATVMGAIVGTGAVLLLSLFMALY